MASKSVAKFISRPSPTPAQPRGLPVDGPRAVLPISFEDEVAIGRFDDMKTFARLWAHAITDGALKLEVPLDKRLESPVGCTLLILYRMLLRCPAVGTFAADWKARVNTLMLTPPAAPRVAEKLGLAPPLTLNPLWRSPA